MSKGRNVDSTVSPIGVGAAAGVKWYSATLISSITGVSAAAGVK